MGENHVALAYLNQFCAKTWCSSTQAQLSICVNLSRQLCSEGSSGLQALMEFTRFRFEGVDPEYARAVQLRQRNPRTNQEEVPNAQVLH